MVTTAAILHGDRARLLGFDPAEHPVAAQLGGSEPADLAEAARICAGFGYDEVNLNVGCPSERVQNGAFGACPMREPGLVADCVAAMKAAVAIPVTVKCRIGVDDQDPQQALGAFAEAVIAAGADALIVHARKAWLKGLSPKDNRSVPPLDYALVHALKQRFPATPVALNGGIETLEAALAQLDHVDGVMIGRAAYQNPALLLQVDPLLFGDAAPCETGEQAIEAFMPVCRGAPCRGSSAARHDAACARPLQWPARRPSLSPASVNRGGEAWGGDRGAARGAGASRRALRRSRGCRIGGGPEAREPSAPVRVKAQDHDAFRPKSI